MRSPQRLKPVLCRFFLSDLKVRPPTSPLGNYLAVHQDARSLLGRVEFVIFDF
jgi:hypothetical protein